MRKIIFYESFEKISLGTVITRMEKECPEYVDKWRREGYMLVSDIIRGVYFPNSVKKRLFSIKRRQGRLSVF